MHLKEYKSDTVICEQGEPVDRYAVELGPNFFLFLARLYWRSYSYGYSLNFSFLRLRQKFDCSVIEKKSAVRSLRHYTLVTKLTHRGCISVHSSLYEH